MVNLIKYFYGVIISSSLIVFWWKRQQIEFGVDGEKRATIQGCHYRTVKSFLTSSEELRQLRWYIGLSLQLFRDLFAAASANSSAPFSPLQPVFQSHPLGGPVALEGVNSVCRYRLICR